MALYSIPVIVFEEIRTAARLDLSIAMCVGVGGDEVVNFTFEVVIGELSQLLPAGFECKKVSSDQCQW
jgi:hypothetical protein